MWARISALAVLGLAGISAAEILSSRPLFFGVPVMAPSTAVCFALLSAALLGFSWLPSRLSWLCAIPVAGVLAIVVFFSGVGRVAMNPVTEVVLVPCAVAFLFGMFATRRAILGHLAGLITSLLVFLSATWVLGYVYGTPVVFVSTGVALKLITAAAFLLFSLAFIAALGGGYLPLVWFRGSSPRARLLRSLIPTVSILVIVEGIASHFISLSFPLNAASLSMGLNLVLVVLLVLAITSTARSLGVQIDQAVSARQNAETALRQAIEGLEVTVQERTTELKRSNESLEQFARVASHDLQEPLRKIRAFGDLLMKKLGDAPHPDAKDYLIRMQNASRRMSALIDALLNYSRVTTKALPPSPVNLDGIFEDVLSDLEIKIQDTKAVIEKGHLPVVEGDAMQMRQLFQNLLGNALKFHKAEVPPVIKVSTVKQGDRWEFKFEDNGIGFDPKYANKIFQVFERLHGRNEYEGTGIGLAICKKIVDRHHGNLIAEGRPGDGATFTFTLPTTQGSRWAQAA